MIDAAGRLFACDAMPEDMRYGDVKNGIDQDAWNKVASRCRVREECRQCVFLPECTEFDRCPTRVEYDFCYRQERRKLDRELRFIYDMYQEELNRTQQHADPESAHQEHS